MSKLNSVQIINKKSLLATALVALHAEYATAKERETLEIGKTYPIKVGRADTADVVDAVLSAQAETDRGMMYRFVVGSGMEAKFVDGNASRVVWDDGQEVRSTEVVNNRIVKAEQDLAQLEADLVVAEQREAVEEGEVYPIKLGRGETVRIVEAKLLGSKVDEKGIKRFNMMQGTGFEASCVQVTIEAFVFASVADEEVEAEQA